MNFYGPPPSPCTAAVWELQQSSVNAAARELQRKTAKMRQLQHECCDQSAAAREVWHKCNGVGEVLRKCCGVRAAAPMLLRKSRGKMRRREFHCISAAWMRRRECGGLNVVKVDKRWEISLRACGIDRICVSGDSECTVRTTEGHVSSLSPIRA